MSHALCGLLCAISFAPAALAGSPSPGKEHKPVSPIEDWKARTISPVTNPLFFEDPMIHSEIRPIFMHHEIDNTFLTRGGDVRVYAVELRWAITPRLAFIATKDGYIDLDPSEVLGDEEGWANIAGGFKYALIDDPAHEFILTPGFKFEFPSGDGKVFQGNGSGEWDVFVSAEKGFGNFHVIANTGFRLPNDWSEQTAQWHYSLQLDYWVCRYFIPFVAMNGFTVLNAADTIPLTTEGFDLINFGSSRAQGKSQIAVGVGFRSRILDNLDFGFAYEKAATTPHGLYGDRFTVDFVWRF